jgi:hypothetical protein
MTAKDKWKRLGWRHPVWDLLRYYCSLERKRTEQARWLEELEQAKRMKVGESAELPIDPTDVGLFFEYLIEREVGEAEAYGYLRNEDAAVKACVDRGLAVEYTKTKSKDHHQSPKAVVALVNHIVEEVCRQRDLAFDPNPQSRCVWCTEKQLHVTARNLDGAIPGLANPIVIWENKEYWGRTKGGSKMSDAVYACNLVGRELREFEESSGVRVVHVVFLDGMTQWTDRPADLRRFVDLTNQTLIDYLFVGTEIETGFEAVLNEVLSTTSNNGAAAK